MTDREILLSVYAQIGVHLGIVVGTTPTTPTTPTGPTTPFVPPFVPPSGPAVPGQMTGNPLLGGHMLVQFGGPGDPPIYFNVTVPSDGKRWTLDGDNGWMQGDVTVSVNGSVVDRASADLGAGSYYILATCVDNEHTREHGVARTAIDMSRVA
jgi:hypothetical protein